jgi:hypothetical protein
MSTLKADVVQSSTGGATTLTDLYPARAWVNFNAQSTMTVRASGNTSSMTDLGTGYYQMNLTTSMVDASYAISGMSKDGDGLAANLEGYFHINNVSTGSLKVYNTAQGSADDTDIGCLLVTR